MKKRITKNQLEALVLHLNEITGNPIEPYSKDEQTGRYTASPGHYHLYYAYGGVALDQTANEGGGTRRISTDGCGTKRELYNFLQAYVAGIEK